MRMRMQVGLVAEMQVGVVIRVRVIGESAGVARAG
jgi:hypothetical protein